MTTSDRSALLYGRLITLMQMVDDSGTIAYPRRLRMPNLNRQLIFVIGLYGSTTSKNLALLSGREKAQISRGVKALSEAGLIDRARRRGDVSLSEAGQALFLDSLKIARERDRLLRQGLSDEEVARFLGITATLIDRASSIFVADERGEPIDLQARSSLHHPPELDRDLPSASLDEPSFRDLIMPWLQSLLTYMRRSGIILFKREVGLSNFEWRVLSLIEENQPARLSSLIDLVSRDKSQVARMVKQLNEAGLLDRRDEGRVNVSLRLTDAGREAYEAIRAISAERDGFLFASNPPEDRTFYLAVIDRLITNAQAMLEAEQHSGIAREDEDRSPDCAPARSKEEGADDPPLLDALREENRRLKQLLAEAVLENALLRDRLTEES